MRRARSKRRRLRPARRTASSIVELRIATDALTNVVNLENDWATCLTVEQLNAIWKPGSKVSNWNQIDPSYPDVPLKLYGAGTDSGTFDYFTDVINGEEGASRSDFSATEDDNVTVQGVSGDKGALGYFGFSYFEENQDKLTALEVDGGDGCVAPSARAAQDGSYAPLARPLFMYVKTSSLADTEGLADFVRYTLENEQTIAEEAQFVSLSQEQIDEQLQKLEDATALDGVRGRHHRPGVGHHTPAEENPPGRARCPRGPVRRCRNLGADDGRHRPLAALARARVLSRGEPAWTSSPERPGRRSSSMRTSGSFRSWSAR